MQKRIVDFRDNAQKNYNKRIWYRKTINGKVRTSIKSWKAKVSNTY
jgi:hypothetical protein